MMSNYARLRKIICGYHFSHSCSVLYLSKMKLEGRFLTPEDCILDFSYKSNKLKKFQTFVLFCPSDSLLLLPEFTKQLFNVKKLQNFKKENYYRGTV